ncbi:SRPBCC family protein [Nocardioides stalactiti]|uniref:SRPBCC family protein n=1 Tax=Nocardioides stalactiti TaxID=2755356 RepID=UPI001604288E|nr:SRPBCC family protein [Nocardioides stalactiti]
MTEPRADRELRAEAIVQASPERVWELLTDFANMTRWSPETMKMVPLKGGGLRVGQWYLGINKRKGVVWPTRSVVAAVEPRHKLVWDTKSSGAQWIWELEPVDAGASTRVIHRRPVPKGNTLTSKAFAPVFLGGNIGHADELEQGMARTVAGLKAAAES